MRAIALGGIPPAEPEPKGEFEGRPLGEVLQEVADKCGYNMADFFMGQRDESLARDIAKRSIDEALQAGRAYVGKSLAERVKQEPPIKLGDMEVVTSPYLKPGEVLLVRNQPPAFTAGGFVNITETSNNTGEHLAPRLLKAGELVDIDGNPTQFPTSVGANINVTVNGTLPAREMLAARIEAELKAWHADGRFPLSVGRR